MILENEKLLSRKEAGGRICCSVDTVTRLIRRGSLKAYRLPRAGGKGINQKWLIPESAIAKMLEGK